MNELSDTRSRALQAESSEKILAEKAEELAQKNLLRDFKNQHYRSIVQVCIAQFKSGGWAGYVIPRILLSNTYVLFAQTGDVRKQECTI